MDPYYEKWGRSFVDAVSRVVLAVAAVIILINILLGMVGHPLFRF